MDSQYIKNFSEVNIIDEYAKGRNNYFLGDTYQFLDGKKVTIPEGFVITSKAFDYFIHESKLQEKLSDILSKLDKKKFTNLKEISSLARALIKSSELPDKLKDEITIAKSLLKHPVRSALRLAVGSGTKNDLSCESILKCSQCLIFNISDLEELYKACLKCYALLFTETEIKYRIVNNYDLFDGGISVYVKKMVRSDLACSGIIYGTDPETNVDSDNSIRIDGCWGMVANIAFEKIIPDRFYVSLPPSHYEYEDFRIISKNSRHKRQDLDIFQQAESKQRCNICKY